MESKVGHIYLYVSNPDKSYVFYKNLLGTLGYKQIFKEKGCFAFEKDGTSLWFEKTPSDHLKDGYHRRRTGLNHLAFRLNSREEVDKFCQKFIKTRGLKTLYNTPKAFPEYTKDYYAVFFEDPDKIKLEVVYY